jgi:hypothetical protein
MLRLVWKDIAAARWILLGGLPVYALNMAALSRILPAHLTMALVFSSILAFGSIALEAGQGTLQLWASLPVSRRQIVFARYLSSGVGAALGLGVSFAVERAVTILGTPEETGPSLAASATAHAVLMLVLLLVAAVLLPLCFRLGPGNGVMAFGGVALAGLLLVSLGGQVVLWLAGLSNPLLDAGLYRGQPDSAQVQAAVDWLRQWGPLLLALAAVITGMALLISAGISRRFFETQDIAA